MNNPLPMFSARRGRQSIRRRQTLVIMLTSCVSLLLACGGFVVNEVINFRQSVLDNVTTVADIVANNSTAALQFGVALTARENLATLRSQKNIETT